MENNNLMVSGTPHIRSRETIDSIMRDVIIALCPAAIMGIIFFGASALLEIAVSIAACIFFEFLYEKITKKPITISDLSAVVTGLLLALNLPALDLSENLAAAIWMPCVGSFFAIFVAKMLFGGLGQNFINPALAGRAFLVAAYPTLMTGSAFRPTNFMSADAVGSATSAADAVSYATPLTEIKAGTLTTLTSSDYFNAIIGNMGGTIGETCTIALVLGGIYLIARKVISWKTPVVYILTVLVLTYILKFVGGDAGAVRLPLYEIFTGGLMLGAFFMATDYASTPITPKGKIIIGLGCGFITVMIRVYGGYPEGVSYSILLMNLCTPLIDKFTAPKKFGYVKPVKVKEVK